jgi:hypothetical protein
VYFTSSKDYPKLKFDSNKQIKSQRRRKRPREDCLIPAIYNVYKEPFLSFILDINIAGALFETDQAFPVGEKIIINYVFQSPRKIQRIQGTIKWSSDTHMGVKFD